TPGQKADVPRRQVPYTGAQSDSRSEQLPAHPPTRRPHARFFFFKQKTAYEIGLDIPAEPLFRSTDAASGVVDIFHGIDKAVADTWNNFWKDGKADGIGSNLSRK